ncbi:DUF6053 domain-containing protein [Lysobacter sp. CA199]|uniref:DUF6053 domain-containing protein n=1 Tax=Lysobacter sp. CA199 TaxID=3455608 RepID=UPI003F8D8B9C
MSPEPPLRPLTRRVHRRTRPTNEKTRYLCGRGFSPDALRSDAAIREKSVGAEAPPTETSRLASVTGYGLPVAADWARNLWPHATPIGQLTPVPPRPQ